MVDCSEAFTTRKDLSHVSDVYVMAKSSSFKQVRLYVQLLRWPKRVKHKSVYKNTKQFPKTQISLPKHKSCYQNTNKFTKTQNNFLKHKPIFQNTNPFTKTQINFTKHKPISRNTNQKTGHLLCYYQRASKGLIPRISPKNKINLRAVSVVSG